MPPRGPATSTPPAAAAPVAAPAATHTAQASTPTPTRAQAPYPPKRAALPPMPGAGIAYAPEPEGNGGGDFNFPNLDAGDYLFSAWVDTIIMWPDGAAVGFKCHGQIAMNGDGTINKSGVYGRELAWAQTPPPSMGPGSKGFPYWRRDLVSCYRDIGLPDLPDEASGVTGWAAAEGENGALVPPFYTFFTDTIGRAIVPIMLRIKVRVDAGYEKYPKIKGLAYEQVGDSYVLAPTPRKLPDWVATMHGWTGEADMINIKSKGISIPILKNISGINPPADMPTHRGL